VCGSGSAAAGVSWIILIRRCVASSVSSIHFLMEGDWSGLTPAATEENGGNKNPALETRAGIET
jgi:hypothetical protein